MVDVNKKPRYDLEDRTQNFAIRVRVFLKKLLKTRSNEEDSKQLIRSSASVAANYIEASEALSSKDFIYRVKVCRKEAKESILFLRLLDTNENKLHNSERNHLIQEATELMRIFGAIITKTRYKT